MNQPAPPLRFGTAGLRAPLGPGPGRMNTAVVRRAASAIAAELLESGIAGPPSSGPVVVGHDARHGSAAFAADVTQVLVAHGIDVLRFDDVVPTPLVAFAVRHVGAAAGIVITASHNPASDNGLKLYGADGAQIVPPTDARIETRMARPTGGADPGRATGARTAAVTVVPARTGDLVEHYLAGIDSLVQGRAAAPLRVVHTALHGVGDALLEASLDRVDGVEHHAVEDQRRPDPDFPTVPDPNPEHHTTLTHLLAEATRRRADLALALDPDADRLAAAVPDRRGGWQVLSGDELGAVLCADRLQLEGAGGPGSTGRARRFVASTFVSSQLVPAMCAAAGVHHEETATGFKWLCRPGLAHPDWRQLLLYEEALGYAVGPDARDKDGIAAARCLVAAVATLATAGHGVLDLLEGLSRRHGAHVTDNGSVPRPTRRTVDAVLDAVLDPALAALGRERVLDRDRPASDTARLRLDTGTRVLVRPSGTEPKLKYYLEAVEPVTGSAPEARLAATERLALVRQDLLARLDLD